MWLAVRHFAADLHRDGEVLSGGQGEHSLADERSGRKVEEGVKEFVGLEKQPVGACNDDAERSVVEGKHVPAPGEVVEREGCCDELGTDKCLIRSVGTSITIFTIILQTEDTIFWELKVFQSSFEDVISVWILAVFLDIG